MLLSASLCLAACLPPASGDDDDGGGDGSAASSDGGGSSSAGSSDGGSGSGGMAEGSSSSTTSGNADSGSGGSSSESTGGGLPPSWSIHSHTCPGPSRTDALLVEDDAMWVGCGTNQLGYGLHGSDDDGQSWHAITSEPEGETAQLRVTAIARGDDGLLYVAGFDANDSDMILGYDTTVAPAPVQQVLVAGNQIGTSFPVGSLGLLSGGRIFAESQTGFGALFRPDDTVGANALAWDDVYYWANGGNPPGYQMLDLVVFDDRLYGCGSTIAEPPYVFLPAQAADAPGWAFDAVELPNEGWTGEMWGVAATDTRVVAVGVDQDADVGKIFVSGDDPYDGGSWTHHDLPDIVGGGNLGTWARGVCASGDRIAVVGERQPLSAGTGLVMLSEDGGASFSDITPADDVTESVSKCAFAQDGTLVVAGAGGFIGRYGPGR
ncbi:MAG: hypothetical protein K1X88_13725 [Nannocystaceae bacterium]|nr:hypothetical protein [Nannocystaceae bacterium]